MSKIKKLKFQTKKLSIPCKFPSIQFTYEIIHQGLCNQFKMLDEQEEEKVSIFLPLKVIHSLKRAPNCRLNEKNDG